MRAARSRPRASLDPPRLVRSCMIGFLDRCGGALEPRLFATAPDLVPFCSLASRVSSARIIWPCDRLRGPMRSRCRGRLPASLGLARGVAFNHRGQRQHHLKSVSQRDNVHPESTTAEQITRSKCGLLNKCLPNSPYTLMFAPLSTKGGPIGADGAGTTTVRLLL
jgi:hypothetical protein